MQEIQALEALKEGDEGRNLGKPRPRGPKAVGFLGESDVGALERRVTSGRRKFEVGFGYWCVWWDTSLGGLYVQIQEGYGGYGYASHGDLVKEFLYMSLH